MIATKTWHCQGCGVEIHPGDEFFIIDGMIVCCLDCTDDHRETAEEPEEQDELREATETDINAAPSRIETGLQLELAL